MSAPPRAAPQNPQSTQLGNNPPRKAVHDVPRIDSLKVINFRALKSIEVRNLTPLTVLLGPNGSGKSTFFDVFGFLSDCFESGLRRAWDRRGRAREIQTRGSTGPTLIEIKYREPGYPLITYHLAIEEERGAPVVAEEWLAWRRGQRGRPFRFLDYKRGEGSAVSGEQPDEKDERITIPLQSSDLLAVNALGQFAEHPRVASLRNFITGWYVSYLSADSARGQPEAGPQERLSRSGDNLPNVIQYLAEQHPSRLEEIFKKLRMRVPRLERITAEPMPDGRMLLLLKDAPFDSPILARFASDGTLKMLCYLLVLNDPSPPPFIGIEEPENFLYPKLLGELAEECQIASGNTQLLVTSHSPFFVNPLRPNQVKILWRDRQGYTQIKGADEVDKIKDLVEAGALLGDLWMEGFFDNIVTG